MTSSELVELADDVGVGYHKLIRRPTLNLSDGVDIDALRLKVRKESLE